MTEKYMLISYNVHEYKADTNFNMLEL